MREKAGRCDDMASFLSKANNTLVADKICCDALHLTCQGRP